MEDENKTAGSSQSLSADSSLEQPSTTVSKPVEPDKAGKQPQKPKKKTFKDKFQNLTHGVNIYLIAFGVLLAIAGIVTYVALTVDEEPTLTVSNQDLSQEAVEQLLEKDTSIGDITQTLKVEANAIFSGKVLVKDDLDVAGSINVGGPLTLPGITVSGTSVFDNVKVNDNLSVSGNATVQNTLTAQSGINVSGDGSFSGKVTAERISVGAFELSGDFELLRHLDAGGPVPRISKGSATGGAGTVSISGTDTAGTVTINTGSGTGSGTLASITFSRSFGATPHVVISPVNSAAANLKYYATRNSSSFAIKSNNTPSSTSTYIFDYVVIE